MNISCCIICLLFYCILYTEQNYKRKMCSFTVLGGLGGSENHSVSGVTTICLTQCNTSPSHWVDQVVYCGLWKVGPLLFNGCWKFLDIGRNWNTLSYTPIQSIPNMLNGWHLQWVCWPFKNWDVFSFQELCTDPCNMGPCIIMLQHDLMVRDEWHNNGPQDLVTVTLCIQNAINKMPPCSFSITYACPYHNPTATMGHSIHNIDLSKPLTHTTPYTWRMYHQRLYHLRHLRKFRVSPAILKMFYSGALESVLIRCISVWYGNVSNQDCKSQQRVVRLAEHISGSALPSL